MEKALYYHCEGYKKTVKNKTNPHDECKILTEKCHLYL